MSAPTVAAPIRRLWPAEHHRLCDTRQGKACDCYMRFYAETDAALTALLDEVAAAEARAEKLEREVAAQMGSKLEAQMALLAITEGLALRLSDLGNGWTEGAVQILARIEAIVDQAGSDAARAEKAEQALRELKALTRDPAHAARMITRREINRIIDPALAAAAGDTGETP